MKSVLLKMHLFVMSRDCQWLHFLYDFHQHLRTNWNSNDLSSSCGCIFIAHEKKEIWSWNGKSENSTVKCFVVAPELPRQVPWNYRRVIANPIHKMRIMDLTLCYLLLFLVTAPLIPQVPHPAPDHYCLSTVYLPWALLRNYYCALLKIPMSLNSIDL